MLSIDPFGRGGGDGGGGQGKRKHARDDTEESTNTLAVSNQNGLDTRRDIAAPPVSPQRTLNTVRKGHGGGYSVPASPAPKKRRPPPSPAKKEKERDNAEAKLQPIIPLPEVDITSTAAHTSTFFKATPRRLKDRPVVDEASPFMIDSATRQGTATDSEPPSHLLSPRRRQNMTMSNSGTREETEFWNSPPSKTPKPERHALLTPVKNGPKQPDDWWLRSPFKGDRGKPASDKKFHAKMEYTSPRKFGMPTPKLSESQMAERATAPLTGRKSNTLFSDFLPVPRRDQPPR